jgi:hypothetical protein
LAEILALFGKEANGGGSECASGGRMLTMPLFDLIRSAFREPHSSPSPRASGRGVASLTTQNREKTAIRLAETCPARLVNGVRKLGWTLLFFISLAFGVDSSHPSANTGGGLPATWGTNAGKAVPAYYEIKKDGFTDQQWTDALQALPSLSISMDVNDLFGPAKGIYANPLQTGSEWERAAHIEYTAANKGPGFNVNCGIRIQGGWNRRPEESPKHAFRLVFKKKYGPGKLHYPLFDAMEPRAFDELILRAGCNNSWLHWSGEERKRGDYIRDQWMRDSYRAMGHPSARGEFVHLFLNGHYWGIYNLTERPGPEFAAAHFGGKASEYDVRNGENILSGDTQTWNKLFSLVNAGLTDSDRYEAVAALLDLPAFADFMILNLYGANADWDRASNWYAARRSQGKFHFFIWDGERTLEDLKANTIDFDDDQSPPRLFQKLRENSNFKKLFAERARLHLTGPGALTSEKAAARFKQWSDKLDPAIIAEAARWGAYRHDIHQYKIGPYEVYTRDQHWRPEINRIRNELFPKRNAVLLEQFAAADLGHFP